MFEATLRSEVNPQSSCELVAARATHPAQFSLVHDAVEMNQGRRKERNKRRGERNLVSAMYTIIQASAFEFIISSSPFCC